MIQRTLSIIKPDAVSKNSIGSIIQFFEKGGLKVVAARMEKLTIDQARKFYKVHENKPFFNELINFMCSGPSMLLVLEGPNAISKNRSLIGATNPLEANPHTIRAQFAESIQRNAVHGSDNLDTAREEITFFFNKDQCYARE